MNRYRLIIMSNDSGSQESVIFLDADNTDKAEDWCIRSHDAERRQHVDSDTIIDADLPSGFPVNYTLNRDR